MVGDVEAEEQEADEEEQMEAAEVRAKRGPTEPTEAEMLKHEATHVPYRSWCQHCVRGRGRRKPHYRRDEGEGGNKAPKVSMDYFFLGGEECEASENPVFVMLDEECGSRYARMLDHKGMDEGRNEWLILDAADEIRSWGHVEGCELILKTDNEASMLAVREALRRYL